MERFSIVQQLGEPTKRVKMPEGMLEMWAQLPFIYSRIEGYAAKAMGEELDIFYRSRYPEMVEVVTIHDWSHLTDYDTECRKILQQLTQFMRAKQNEIVIHLGPADTLVQKVIRTTAETIQRFKRMPIEMHRDDDSFQKRVRELQVKYQLQRRHVG